jgi:hypothetical protein
MDVLQDALGRIGPSALRTHLEFERDWKVKDASLAEHFYKLILEQVMPYFTNLCTRRRYLSPADLLRLARMLRLCVQPFCVLAMRPADSSPL